jgi:hypothetical protein
MIERRDAMEFFRDAAADQFRIHTRNAWSPRAGSMVNRKMLTASMIDSRDFAAARRRADTSVLIPLGAKIAFTGGADFNDHARIWTALDRVHAKHPDMAVRPKAAARPTMRRRRGRDRRRARPYAASCRYRSAPNRQRPCPSKC